MSKMTISIYYQNGYFCVWNVEDVQKLRSDYRIIGAMIGACPEYPREAKSVGLPMILKDIHVRLLQELNVITIMKEEPGNTEYLKQASNVELNKELLTIEIEESNRFSKDQRLQAIEKNFEKILSGKLQTLGKKLSIEEESIFRIELKSKLLKSSAENSTVNSKDSVIRFKISSPYSSGSSIHLSEVTSKHDSLRYATFKHFWFKGYFVTDAMKFAADFMIYDDDPVQFHAKFVIFCCSNPEKRQHFIEVLSQAYGRLGKNVRKNILVSSFRNNHYKDDVIFEHIQWTQAI